ncbi:hypothetical protein LMG3410_02062 [Achromobacter aegrifaciens]|uniref:hypothetical protein n=1 Tax=Achromobacter aegrifaciens TaxID=1287736 RepID=UPI0014689445|nr:hypothetical protein [Achromobacter aegrifaciens]CAB3856676.1 hypothetical protein LMG3410_02062 [Achromobacter aegrifaciens]
MNKERRSVADDPVSTDIGQPAQAVTWPQIDEHHGRGGSYLRDSATGERILVERTDPCAGCQSR